MKNILIISSGFPGDNSYQQFLKSYPFAVTGTENFLEKIDIDTALIVIDVSNDYSAVLKQIRQKGFLLPIVVLIGDTGDFLNQIIESK